MKHYASSIEVLNIATSEVGRSFDVLVDGELSLEGVPAFSSSDEAFFPWPYADGGTDFKAEPSATWVRRGGSYIFWLYADQNFEIFRRADYVAALGGSPDGLPPVERDLAARIDASTERFPRWYVADWGDEIPCDLAEHDATEGPWTRLRAWPDAGGASLTIVEPPAEGVDDEYSAEGPREQRMSSLWVHTTADGRKALLAPGVLRLPVWVVGPDVDTIAATIAPKRWPPRRTIVVDCAGIGNDKAEFWQRYVDQIPLENAVYFGRNFDALWDALSGGGPGWPGWVTLKFIYVRDLDAGLLASLRRVVVDLNELKRNCPFPLPVELVW